MRLHHNVLFILLVTIAAFTTAQTGSGIVGTPAGNANQVVSSNSIGSNSANVQIVPPNTPSTSNTNTPPIPNKNLDNQSIKNNKNDFNLFSNISLDDALLDSSALANGSYIANSPFSSSSTSAATTAANIGKILFSLPKCFTKCSTDIANSISNGSCTSMLSFHCSCEKPGFVDNTIKCAATSRSKNCAGLSQYPHLLQQGHDIFTNLCKAAGVSTPPNITIITPTYPVIINNGATQQRQQRAFYPIILALGFLTSLAVLDIL